MAKEIIGPVFLDRDDLMRLVEGVPIPSGGIEDMTDFTGDQHNPGWKWSGSYLKELTESELWQLYTSAKKHIASGTGPWAGVCWAGKGWEGEESYG